VGLVIFTVSPQSDNISLSIPLEELEDKIFSSTILNSEQIEEGSSTSSDIENANITDVLIQLR
jgi:hypothetical protein